MIRIYFASKLKHGAKWRGLGADSPDFIAHARWLKHNLIGIKDTELNASRFWVEDIEDIHTADAVIVYAESDEHLRGALVEAGIAIAYNIPVIVIGQHPDYGTWQHHPGVYKSADVDHALIIARELVA